MLAHKLIEKYLSDNNVDYFAYERYDNNKRNPYHLINILLNDGTDVLFKISFNYNATDIFDEMRYKLSIYNDLSGRMVETYSNGNLGSEDILRKVMGYKDKFKIIDGNETIKESGVIGICNSDIRSMVGECVRRLLNEDQTAKSISAAIRLLMYSVNMDHETADRFVRVTVRSNSPILRTNKGAKFILGVTRLYVDGDTTREMGIERLNTVLPFIVKDENINKFDRNLNGYSLTRLLNIFRNDIESQSKTERAEFDEFDTGEKTKYIVYKIDSFKTAKKFSRFTSWCITHSEEMFDRYSGNGTNQFYFCLADGFENVQPVRGENCPLDEYGLSMIAVSVDSEGSLATCTCRWNHDNGGNDGIMDSRAISRLIGRNFYKVFKPNNNWATMLADIKERLKNPNYVLEEIFDYVSWDSGERGIKIVELSGKYNYVTKDRRLLSDIWFDDASEFSADGYGIVRTKYGENFIDESGNYLFNDWYDTLYYFINGIALVERDRKYNYIRKDETFISDIWFDDAHEFYEDLHCAKVCIDGKGWNIIDEKGNFLSNEWYKFIGNEGCGFIEVIKVNPNGDNMHNFIDRYGKRLFNTWFLATTGFRERTQAALVKFIDKNGDTVDAWVNAEGNLFEPHTNNVIGKID